MKEVAIGYNSKDNSCCVIESLATFDMLKQNFELYKVNIRATNWGGCDTVKRTEVQLNKKVNWNNSFPYYKKVHGQDWDCGHCYSWTFEFDTVYELV